MPVTPVSRDDVIQIIFTSGATADPKGVVIRHRNVLANIVPVEREVLKYRKYARPFHPLRFLNLLPLSHMFGQSMASSIPPMVHGIVIFTRSFNPHDVLSLIHRRRVSVLVCVPKILGVLREHVIRTFPEAADPPRAGISIPGRWWKYRRIHRAFGLKFWAFVVGAAPLPPEIEEFWRRLGFAVIQGYGLTETAPIVTVNHPFKTSRGSVGTPIEGVEVRIADDGEILVRGENVTSGYYEGSRVPAPDSEHGRSEPEARVLDSDGWLHTGDIGERDAQGRLFIKGRKKEMIVRPDGLNVFPEDVERALDAQEGVRESAVVGIVDGAEERVHAVLVLESGRGSACSDSKGQRPIAGPPACPHVLCVARLRPASHRGHEKAEAQRHPRLGPVRQFRGTRWSSRYIRVAAGALCTWPRSGRIDDARGAWAQLARAGGADGCARGSLSDAARRRTFFGESPVSAT